MNIIIVLPKLEDSRSVRSILVRNGLKVASVCATGDQAMAQMDELGSGIVICGYKLQDMLYSQLYELMPSSFEMLLVTSKRLIEECGGGNIVSLSTPFQTADLISTVHMMLEERARRKRRAKQQPKSRTEEDQKTIWEAKRVLMDRNHMTEEEAHQYLLRRSMESGTQLVETASMILALMRS